MKKYISFIIVILVVLLISIIAIFSYSKYQNKIAYENEWNKNIFNITEFAYFSSASATSNDTGNEAKWDINPYQYVNLAFKVNNQNDYTGKKSKNTIKNIQVENFKIIEAPQIGNLSFNYISPENLSLNELKLENVIENNLSYEVKDFNEQLDYTKPQINRNGGYISFQIVNSNIKNNFVITDITTPLTYNGELLQRAEIDLEDLKYKLAFDVIVTNDLDEQYKCTIEFDAPIKSEMSDDTLYSLGSISNYKTDTNIYNFERIK